jgi:endonuclease/exonuclease/phosphatase family metal-dependent hydrolase
MRWIIALVALSAIALGVGSGVRTATGPASGTRLRGAGTVVAVAASRPATLRLGTFNIHSGVGADGKEDLGRVAEVLRKRRLDVIGLNEVRGPAAWGGGDQAGALGEELGMGNLFLPTERQWGSEHFGNGLLCALPVKDWQRIPLAGTAGRGKRNLTITRVEIGGRTVSILSTHLDRGADREAQLRRVWEHFLEAPEPAVLMGDLNTRSDDPLMRRLLVTPGVDDVVARALGERTPAERIDWILTRGLDGVDAGIVEEGASDHPMVWAEVRIR